MTNMNFDEPSIGAVNDNNKVALNVRARGEGSIGVWGEAEHDNGHEGVVGISKNGVGVQGQTQTSRGINGVAKGEGGTGVWGEAEHDNGRAGVVGISKNWVGVHGKSNHIGIYGEAPVAGRFEGNVEVTAEIHVSGDIRLLGGDCAEEFDLSYMDKVEPGTVMVLSSNEDALEPGSTSYDKRVAGIVSGAGGFKPGIVLDKKQLQESNENKRRVPVALMGKVYCKVDADYSPIEVGDLLTTSQTVGHAMKASDPIKAFGTVIGKALKPLREGRGMIPVLVALQ
jgi:hypothetical protein